VAASCAIRGFFEPVPINGRRYVDGGLNSLCHLDLLEGSDLDVVICFSAMTAPLQRPGAQLVQRAVHSLFAAAAEQLDRQVQTLTSRGVDVLVVEPTAKVQAAMGYLMDARRWAPVLKAILSSVAEQLRGRNIKERLGTLGSAA
jgi:NTE family protein